MNLNQKNPSTKKYNLEKFIQFIKSGRFVLPYCKKCKMTIWPPADHCRFCLSNLSLKDYKNKKGKILELLIDKFSKNNVNTIMIVVQIDHVILMGSLFPDKIKKGKIEGKKVRIKDCGFIDQKIYYQFEIVNN